LTGHSFQVRGASFWISMKVSIDNVKKLCCWELDCYQLYIRPYSPEQTTETKELRAQLDKAWYKATERSN
jgi:hypothetical protein